MDESIALITRERDVDDRAVAPRRKRQSASLEHAYHWPVISKHLGDELVQSCAARNRREVAHQEKAKALSLILMGYREGQFGAAGTDNHITAARHDGALSLIGDGDESHVSDKININEKCDLLLREVALGGEEATRQRTLADTSDRRNQTCTILGPERADFNAATVAQ
jgi:hypothetical protein